MGKSYVDVLAMLGVGSAHPGGFGATLAQLEQMPIAPGSRILDAGCGTGRTACALAARGHKVTGLDLHPEMIRKAIFRAEQEGLEVRFEVGNTEQLPFENRSFDYIWVESVSVFTDLERTLSEFHRVLDLGGRLIDREMMARIQPPAELPEQLSQGFGIHHLLMQQQWEDNLRKAGFASVAVHNVENFDPNLWTDLLEHPDLHQIADDDAYDDDAVWEKANSYDYLLNKYRDVLCYTVFIGEK